MDDTAVDLRGSTAQSWLRRDNIKRCAMWLLPGALAAWTLAGGSPAEMRWRGTVLMVAVVLAGALFVVTSADPGTTALGTAIVLGALSAVGVWNPWNLVAVDALLNHPAIATAALCLLAAGVLIWLRPAAPSGSVAHMVAGIVAATIVIVSVLTIFSFATAAQAGLLVGWRFSSHWTGA